MCTLDGKTVDAAEKNTIVSSYAPVNVNPQGGGWGYPGDLVTWIDSVQYDHLRASDVGPFDNTRTQTFFISHGRSPLYKRSEEIRGENIAYYSILNEREQDNEMMEVTELFKEMKRKNLGDIVEKFIGKYIEMKTHFNRFLETRGKAV